MLIESLVHEYSNFKIATIIHFINNIIAFYCIDSHCWGVGLVFNGKRVIDLACVQDPFIVKEGNVLVCPTTTRYDRLLGPELKLSDWLRNVLSTLYETAIVYFFIYLCI